MSGLIDVQSKLRLKLVSRKVRASALFDANYYLANHPDVRTAQIDPATHFAAHGWKEHRNPSGAFDTAQYLSDYPDVAEAGLNPLVHYLTHGRSEGRSAKSAMHAVEDEPVRHVDAIPADTTAVDAEVESIRASGLFDEAFYLSACADLPAAANDPIRHYCEYGWREGRNPSAGFDTQFYVTTHSDVLAAGINPLWHYVAAGAAEHRKTSPDLRACEQEAARFYAAALHAEAQAIRASGLFDEVFYLSAWADLAAAPSDPIRHYCEQGWREGRNPSDGFDTRFYLATYSDIREAELNPFWHYLAVGAAEHRRARPDFSARQAEDLGLDPAAIDAEVEDIKASGRFDEAFYLSVCADLPDDPVRHYCERGWREGRNPSEDFDTAFYLATNSDIRSAGLNPLWHYVAAGAAEHRPTSPRLPGRPAGDFAFDPATIDAEVEDIKASGRFDEAFYLSVCADLPTAPDDPIRHYCERGWREGRNPSEDFDTAFYLATYRDIRNAGLNPLWHYATAGAAECRLCLPAADRYEEDVRFGGAETDIMLLAFYKSPDWSVLTDERQLFVGHQPPQPDEVVGRYDPLDWKDLQAQAQTAVRHGLRGFCFDLNLSSGEPLERQPIGTLLAHDQIDIPFCAQAAIMSGDAVESVAEALTPILSDRRQIRIGGRPVLVVQIDAPWPGASDFLKRLRRRLAKSGAGAPFLIGRCATGEDDKPLLAGLCDGVLDLPGISVPMEFEPFPAADKNGLLRVPYSVVATAGIERARKALRSDYPRYHAITLARDNTARGLACPLVYTHFNLGDYRRWLDAAIDVARTAHEPDRRLLFVNAWNHWDEGLYLEADAKSGFSRLNETTRALLKLECGLRMPKVSVIVPNYNHERFLRQRLDSIYSQTYQNIEVILLDDHSSDASRSTLDAYASRHADITRTIYNDQNSGGTFRQWAKGIKQATGELIWIAESDDFCDERFLETLVTCFNDEAVLLAHGKSVFVDRDGSSEAMADDFAMYVQELDCRDKWAKPYVATAPEEVTCALGIKNTIPNASGVVFRRPVDARLLDDESWLSMRVAGDWVFYLHMLRGGKIAYRPEAVNFFRRYEGSAAQATYKLELFYREVSRAGRTVAALYDVPWKVLERCRDGWEAIYFYHLPDGKRETFERWYDYESIIQARSDRSPNIMVSTMGFYPGGAEILPIRMANELKRQGHSVLLFSAGLSSREDGVRRMVNNDIPVVEGTEPEDMKAAIQAFGIEALNSHQWHIQKYPLRTPDVFDGLRRHVASLHGMIEHGEAFEATEDQLRGADQKVTTWVYTAEKNLGPFTKFGLCEKTPDRFVKLPNGMQPPEIAPISRARLNIPDDAFVLCCVSRAIPDKGWAETIAAVESARKLSGLDIRLILVGNGPVYDLYCRTGVPDFVHLIGFSENSVGHYAAADMGVMLTRFKSESFPLTIIDCLFAGRPYIATDVGDIRNMLTIGDDVAGAVFALDDWQIPIEQAAQEIAAFASDRSRHERASALVNALASRYRIDAVVAQYVRLLEADRQSPRLGEVAPRD